MIAFAGGLSCAKVGVDSAYLQDTLCDSIEGLHMYNLYQHA
jgi:hypothetical protein